MAGPLMIFRQLNPGPCRTYLVGSERTREVVLVDPLLDSVDRYLALLRSEAFKLRWVIDTRTHADHLSGAAALQAKAQVHYLMHLNSEVRCVSKRLRERDALGLGEITMTFTHAPGPSRDSMLVLLPDRFLSGDFLLIGEAGAGRLDLPGASVEAHYQALRKLEAIPEDFLMFPGHDPQGRESSTLGRERGSNPLLKTQPLDEYRRWWDRRPAASPEPLRRILEANRACATDPVAAGLARGPAAGTVPGAFDGPRAPLMTPVQLRERSARDRSRLFILDVREPDEYAGELGHIPESVLIPLGQLQARLTDVPRDKTVVVVCRSGRRSAQGASLLLGAGYPDACSLAGGMQAWADEKLPVDR